MELYINQKLVECPEDLQVVMTYQTEDLRNPTIVKNSFSKTISIKGTKNNNKIFGEIYKLDRMQHTVNFDPSKRVDFAIYNNGDLVESGYVQLNNISILNGDITYEVTLYGGIGDFFYGLQYNEDGTKKTLADVRFNIEDDLGNVLPVESEFDFVINKELVDKSFNKDWETEGNTLLDTLAFIPSYNGIYQDFDTSKCLINTKDTIFPTSKTEGNTEYTTKNGYALCRLNKSYTEWDVRDLRSYMQRPALKVSKLIKAICNSSGYQVVLDPSFFNSENPYWSKSFLTLPLLTALNKDDDIKEYNTSSLGGELSVGYDENFQTAISESSVVLTTDAVFDSQRLVDIALDVKLKAISDVLGERLNLFYRDGEIDQYIYIGFGAWITIENETGVLATSSVYEFRDDSSNYGIRGNFYYDNGKYTYRFGDQDTYTLKIEGYKVQNAGPLRIVLHLSCSGNPYLMYKGYLGNEPNLNDNVKYRASLSLESSSIKVTNSGSIGSDVVITKSDLLKTEYTPCDYLLNYTKLFGLYYIKDINEKKVTICSRNTFFTGETVNIDDKINYNLNMSISPILFDKKYYSLILNTPETRFAKKYKKDYNQEYGQQRISTGYNFSSETQNFYEDNIYQTTIPILDVSSYYRRYYDATGKEVPCFIADNVTYELYKDDDTNTTDLYAVDIIKSIVELNYTPGNDIFPKTCFYGYDGNTKSLEEVSASLLLWNGQKNCKDILGNDVPYYITDDLTEMIQLNDREPCYLYTESETDISNNKIACKRVVLPQYINLLVDYSNNVTASMDIGLPKEVYCGKVSYDENKTIYYKFWKNYYNDQFDINTKKVTCYVKFNKLSQDDLRKFYWFDNAIWILNKVNDYDVNSDNTTLCEFIKVQNTDNYTIGQNI